MTTDQNYQQIYRVGGMLDAGFVGQITYTISLDQVYDELDIHFSFDKRLYSESDITPELIDRLQTLCTAKYDAPTYPVEEFVSELFELGIVVGFIHNRFGHLVLRLGI